MSIQFSTSVRNARLDAIETTISTSAIMKIRTGAAPADCGTADSGTVLATLSLPFINRYSASVCRLVRLVDRITTSAGHDVSRSITVVIT